jgi:polyphosphate kinase
MVGKKTHAKMLLIVRKERGKLRRYVHLGTGNYHQGNTRIYTDYGLLTCDKGITQDVHELFMQLTTQGPNPDLKKMYQSPYGIVGMLVENIEREAKHAREGKPARIIAKMNGLSSPAVIDSLYAASQAGVEIQLIVRGICCLRPGIKGVSENIHVRSIIGRFLEHDRVTYFANEGNNDVYLSSADWMPRNLRNRIEHCAPVEDINLKTTIINDLESYLKDNTAAWIMHPDGTYARLLDTLTHNPSHQILSSDNNELDAPSAANENSPSAEQQEPALHNAQQALLDHFVEMI